MALNTAQLIQLLLIVRVTHTHWSSQHRRLWHLASLSLMLVRRCISSSSRSSPTSHKDSLLARLLGDCSTHHGVTLHTTKAMGASKAAKLHRSALAWENWRGSCPEHRMLRWHVVVASWAMPQREAALRMMLLLHISAKVLIIDKVHVHLVPGTWSPDQAVLIWHAVRSSTRCRKFGANLVELLHAITEGPSRCSHLLLLKLLKQERRVAARCLGWANKHIAIVICLWLIQVRLGLQITAWLLIDNLNWHLFATWHRV